MIDQRFYVHLSKLCVKELLLEVSKVVPVSCDNEQWSVEDIASLSGANAKSLTYCGSKKYKDELRNTKAQACFVTEDLITYLPSHTIPLITENPRAAFAVASSILYAQKKDDVNQSFNASKECFVHGASYIGSNAKIGNGTVIDPHVHIGPGVVIGDHCHIHSGAVIEKTVMGNHVTVKSGAVIGQTGFGFEQYKGRLVHIPHMGRVIIGSHVSIGANTCVDRGGLEDTIIEDYVQIDNLVQVAHNVHLGMGAIIVGQVGIAGSTTIGSGTIVAGQVGLAEHLRIGKNVKIAAQSGVLRDIKDGQTVSGSPSMPIKDWHKQLLFLAKHIKK